MKSEKASNTSINSNIFVMLTGFGYKNIGASIERDFSEHQFSCSMNQCIARPAESGMVITAMNINMWSTDLNSITIRNSLSAMGRGDSPSSSVPPIHSSSTNYYVRCKDKVRGWVPEDTQVHPATFIVFFVGIRCRLAPDV